MPREDKSMNSKLLPPLPPSPKSFICFNFKNGMSIKSYNVETVQALVEVFKSTPTLDKKDAYFIIDNQVVFLENVDSIKWNLVGEVAE
jgi:hypothetical protein